MGLVDFLVVLLIAVVVVYAVRIAVQTFALPDGVEKLAMLVVAVVALLYVLRQFGWWRGW